MPVSKMFNNCREKFNNTMCFMANKVVLHLRSSGKLYFGRALYKFNKESSRNTLKNYGSVYGLFAVKLLGLPLPLFKYNYIAKEMVDLSNEDFRGFLKPDYTETRN
jgi:hypothetical protein